MGLLAPNPRRLLKKAGENFQAWVCANSGGLMVERTVFENKKDPRCNFFEDGGVGEESFLFKESFFPHVKKHKSNQGRTPDEGSPSFFAKQKNSPSPAFWEG